MLDFLRKRASSLAIKFILSLIIIVFVLWGVGRMREREQNIVGKVGKIEIALNEYQDAVNRLSEGYKMAFGDKFDYKIFKDRIKNEAWDLIVERTILLKKAEELNLKVSDKEVVEEIQKQEAFKENGQFSKDRYLAVLKYMKLSPPMYEKDLERTLLIKKAMAVIKNSVSVSETDVRDYYELKNKRIKVNLVSFAAKDFLKGVTTTDEEEKKYYQENKEAFKKPERADVSYYFVPIDEFLAGVKVEEKELKDYYEENKSEFYKPKTYVLKHIFKAFGKNKEEAKKKIEEAQRLLAKEEFSKVASRYNDDGTKARGGFIGEVSLDRMSPKMAAAVSVLKKGERSQIVESEYGYHIIVADDIKEEGYKGIDEVKLELQERVKAKKARLYAVKKAKELLATLEKGSPDTSKLKKAFVEKENPVFGDLGAMPEVVKTVYATKEGGVFGPLNSSKGVIVGKVNKFDRGYFNFEEVKDKVKESLLKKKALDLAVKKAEEALKTKTFSKKETTDWFSPLGVLPPALIKIKGIDKDIVKLTKNSSILQKAYQSDDAAYIVMLADEEIKNWDPQRDDCKAFYEEFLNNKRTIYYNDWIKEEKASLKIEKNETLIKNM